MAKVEALSNIRFHSSQENLCLPNGKCSDCGNCCSNFLPMTKVDIVGIKKYIKRNKIRAINHKNTILAVKTIDCMCPFRDEDKNICIIYPVRPIICRAYQCNKSSIQMARSLLTEHISPNKFETYDVRKTFFGVVEGDIESALIHSLMLKRADLISKGVF